jgi:SapB morphogen precursor RamS
MHMALLDLQEMETLDAPSADPPPGSRASKGCGNTSHLSLLLC